MIMLSEIKDVPPNYLIPLNLLGSWDPQIFLNSSWTCLYFRLLFKVIVNSKTKHLFGRIKARNIVLLKVLMAKCWEQAIMDRSGENKNHSVLFNLERSWGIFIVERLTNQRCLWTQPRVNDTGAALGIKEVEEGAQLRSKSHVYSFSRRDILKGQGLGLKTLKVKEKNAFRVFLVSFLPQISFNP